MVRVAHFVRSPWTPKTGHKLFFLYTEVSFFQGAALPHPSLSRLYTPPSNTNKKLWEKDSLGERKTMVFLRSRVSRRFPAELWREYATSHPIFLGGRPVV